MKIVVLGAGRVGAAMVQDLAGQSDLDVTVADVSEAALDRLGRVEKIRADLSQAAEVERIAAAHDLAVGAVPGPMGFATARAVLNAGTPLVDISFFEEDAFALDGLAREKNVPALVDCGVAPGLSNLILGHLESTLESVDSFACYVGGLPVERRAPYEYKAPFSPIDVLAEYTRPVRLREHGRTVQRPALGRPERLDVDGVGTLEAFETDGLRTLMVTSQVPNLIEKTLRYPGHRHLMEVLRDSGFLDEGPVTLKDGTEVRPIDLTAHLLFPRWQLREGEEELTAMRLVTTGVENGKAITITYDLLDRTDAATGTTSMARTTGYTCTAMVRLVVDGLWKRPGISPPEVVGRDADCHSKVIDYLAQRGVVLRQRVETA
ncbi:MAG: saccharopine dehydrogenase C-terminal domain-containing protein [Acidobacteriota bacterium]